MRSKVKITIRLPLLMHPYPGCFGSGGFQPTEPWKLLLPHFALPCLQADQWPCQSATAVPACCQHCDRLTRVLKPEAQTCGKTKHVWAVASKRSCLLVNTWAHLSELSAGLGVCKGRSAVQKSSTVNLPSLFSAPYIATTLPTRSSTCFNVSIFFILDMHQ